MSRKIIQVEERPPLLTAIPLSIQHLFAMFGASILVPTLFHIDPAVVLLMNGIGTLLFILITKGKAPAFLGSSFAFLAPVSVILGDSYFKEDYSKALGGFVIVGLTFCLVAFIIKFFGTKWIDIVLPAPAMGAVVALIGLELASVATNMGTLTGGTPDSKSVLVFFVTLATAIFGSILFRKFFGVIPILIAFVVGYLTAMAVGLVNPSELWAGATSSGVMSMPDFTRPTFDINAILIILPAVLVVISEHIGHQIVTGKIIERDLTKDPGLFRSLLADGISTTLSGLVGSVPTTTYGENIGVMAITKVYSVWVIGGAALLSIIIAFFTPISYLITSIPAPVIGGVSFLLYGMIATSGIRLLVDAKVDYSKARNLVLTSVVLIAGLSGAYIPLGSSVRLSGMALGAVVGMALGIIFYVLDKLKLTNDYEKK